MSTSSGVPARDVIAILDHLYPRDSAQSWDRVGLVTGDPDQSVRRVHLAVDPTLSVIEEAREQGAHLLITHHPLLLRGVHAVATDTGKGAVITALIRAGIALFAAHTNADVAQGGVNDALAEALGLEQVGPLAIEEGRPMGRIGTLPDPMTLRRFADQLALALPSAPVGVRVSGPPGATVRRVAVLGGAGDSLLGHARHRGADVYVTSDLRHHAVSEAREEARGGPPYLIDAGHWASEWLWLDAAARQIVAALGPAGTELEVFVSRIVTDPWTFVVGVEPACLEAES